MNIADSMLQRLPAATLLAVLCVAMTVRAGATEIVTLDGKRYQNSFTLSGDGIHIAAAAQDVATIPASHVLHADSGITISPTFPAIVMTSGETLTLTDVPRMGQTGIVCVPRLKPAPTVIPTEKIACIITAGDTFDLANRIPAGQAGVLLKGGDFFQGDVEQLDPNHVRVNSLLLGIQYFDCRKQIIAVVFHDTARPEGEWIARLLDGSVLLLGRLKCAANEWLADDAQLGAIRIAASNLSTIDAGGSQVTALADRAPDVVPGGAFTLGRTTLGLPMKLFNTPVHSGIGQRANSSISWKIAGKYQAFVARAGVPASMLPVGKVCFSVVADGKLVFRSKLLSSVDEPARILVGLNGVTLLTLMVEPAESALGELPISGLWADPICVNAAATVK